MVLLMDTLESFARNMSVNLRSRNVTVPKKHLHHAQVSTVVQQVRGKRVS